MKEKETVGFVILVWNSEKVIGNCLLSIVGLQNINPHVIIVNNGSTDNTESIINQYCSDYPGIIECIHFNENKGTTISRNVGILKLKDLSPDYYCILDSDTKVNSDAFEIMIQQLENNPKYGLIGPEMVTSGGLLQMSARSFPTALEKFYKAFPVRSIQAKGEAMETQNPPYPGAESYPVDYLMSACWLIKPIIIEKVGLLDEKIFYAPEDAEYCIRVWKSGYYVAFCPTARIIHEWQRLSKKKVISKMNWEHIKGLLYMFNKHHYFFSIRKLKKTFK